MDSQYFPSCICVDICVLYGYVYLIWKMSQGQKYANESTTDHEVEHS